MLCLSLVNKSSISIKNNTANYNESIQHKSLHLNKCMTVLRTLTHTPAITHMASLWPGRQSDGCEWVQQTVTTVADIKGQRLLGHGPSARIIVIISHHEITVIAAPHMLVCARASVRACVRECVRACVRA